MAADGLNNDRSNLLNGAAGRWPELLAHFGLEGFLSAAGQEYRLPVLRRQRSLSLRRHLRLRLIQLPPVRRWQWLHPAPQAQGLGRGNCNARDRGLSRRHPGQAATQAEAGQEPRPASCRYQGAARRLPSTVGGVAAPGRSGHPEGGRRCCSAMTPGRSSTRTCPS